MADSKQYYSSTQISAISKFNDIRLTGFAYNYSQLSAITKLNKDDIDIIVLGAELDGIEAGNLAVIQKLKKEYPFIKVIFLSFSPNTSNDCELIKDLIKAGASAYLNKNLYNAKKLLETIRLVKAGKDLFSGLGKS